MNESFKTYGNLLIQGIGLRVIAAEISSYTTHSN